MCLSQCLFVFVSVPVCVWSGIYLCLFGICLRCLSICLCLSQRLFVFVWYLFMFVLVSVCVCLVSLFVCLSVCLCLSQYLFVFVSVSVWVFAFFNPAYSAIYSENSNFCSIHFLDRIQIQIRIRIELGYKLCFRCTIS